MTPALLLLALDLTGHVANPAPKTEIRISAPGFFGSDKKFDIRVAKLDAKGNFTFNNVPKEFSIVEAIAWNGKKINYAWTSLNGKPILLTMAPVPVLKGRVVTTTGPLPKGIVITLPGEISEPVARDGSFTLGTFPPDKYDVEVEHLPAGARVQNMKVGSSDAAGNVIDLRRQTGDLTITIALR